MTELDRSACPWTADAATGTLRSALKPSLAATKPGAAASSDHDDHHAA